ncbi:MAG: hypothetical protein MUO40_00365, partial [Anaerolineaceae bacterium]|nr:hypothetical protein [Anaerolineaceae bacterium]
ICVRNNRTHICAATADVYNNVGPPYSLSPRRSSVAFALPDGALPRGLRRQPRYSNYNYTKRLVLEVLQCKWTGHGGTVVVY